jgi:hypothetical protein
MTGCAIEFEYDLQPCSASAETEKLEAELEKAEHKYRISVRKQKIDKVKKLAKRIDEIKKILSIGVNDDESYMTTSSGDDSKEAKKRFKKTELGIRFAVPGNATQIINVMMRANRQVTEQKLPETGVEAGAGKFVIYESKNTDTQKRVTFAFTMNYQVEKLQLEPLSPIRTSPHLMKPSVFPTKQKLPSPKADAAPLQHETISEAVPAQQQSQVSLNIHPTEVDLGKVTVGETVSCQIKIENTSSTSNSGFVIITKPQTETKTDTPSMKFNFSKRNGVLGKKESCVIDISCEPQYVGPQRHNIFIQNLVTKQIHTLLIACNPHRPPPVRFPLLANLLRLDFGNVYIDRTQKFSKIMEFPIENKRDEVVIIDASCNVPSQVHIFEDEECTIHASSLKILPFSSHVVYIALTPYFSDVAIESGKCRVLVGGLKFKVYDEKRALVLFERVVPFKAVVGYSILHCSTNLIDFGCTTELGKVFTGKFSITNKSMYMPLEYEIEPSAPDVIKLDVYKGKLEAIKTRGRSYKTVKFSMKAAKYGLNNTVLRIKNKMNKEKVFEVSVRAFVDEKSLSTNLPQSIWDRFTCI